MERRALLTIAATLILAASAGCGSSAPKATPEVKVLNPPPAPGHRLLAEFDDGVGAVQEGASAPIWREPDAVAALDGSAVFSIRKGDEREDHLVRLDPRSGSVVSESSVPTHLSVSAVAPGGRWVAMTDRTPGYGSQGRGSTDLDVFAGATGTVSSPIDLKGDLQPEAFSTDGKSMFTLSYFPDHYRVETIDVATGDHYDTSARDKGPVEDMHGHAVHGVLSADHTLLATLYRDPTDAGAPAFVHVLDLQNGWSYCADLPGPFGTGTPGSDAIQLLRNDVVEVAATHAERIAEVRIDAVHTPTSPVTVTYRTGTIAPPPTSLTAISGFDHVIASLPTE